MSFPEPRADDLVPDPLDRAALALGLSATGEAVADAAGDDGHEGLRGRLADAADGVRALPDRARAQARRLVSLAFEQAWREPLPLRSPEHLAAALADAAHDDELAERLRSIGGMAATAAAARATRWAKRIPAARVLVVATTALELAGAARRGARELTAVGSYLLLQARAAGVDVDRDRWERATLELVLKPSRPPSLEASVPALVGRMAASWGYRAVRPSSDKAVTKRASTMARAAAALPPTVLAPAPPPR